MAKEDTTVISDELSRIQTRPSIISIEGIPGSRKSEILSALKTRYEGSLDIVVLTEPLQYNTPTSSLDDALLEGYLKNPELYGLTFQIAYFLAMSKLIGNSIINNMDKRVIVCERSLLTARHVYFPLLQDHLPTIHQEVYKSLFEDGGVRHVMPDEVILLDSREDKCPEYVNKYKDTEGNRFLTKEYMEKCRSLLTQPGIWDNSILHKIDADPGDIDTTVSKITEIVERIEGVEIEMLPRGPEYPCVISIEGNVGAGKSSLLRSIKNRLHLENRQDIIILEEPVNEWVRITNGAKNILQCLYETPNLYAFAFQTLVAVTTMKAAFKAANENPGVKVILCERSLLSSRGVFAEALKDDGAMNEMESKVYDELFHEGSIEWMYPKKIVYLKTSPESCLGRIGIRGRMEEKDIDIDWLWKYQGYHEKALPKEKGRQLLIIEGDTTSTAERESWVGKVLELCQETLEISQGKSTREEQIQDDKSSEKKKGSMLIKVRYESQIWLVGTEGDSFQQIKEKIIQSCPDINAVDIKLSWKRVKGGSYITITTEEEFKETLNVMNTQGRPVARFIMANKERGETHQEMEILLNA
jgi:deoxyadenosine/deoxycytidine kinase